LRGGWGAGKGAVLGYAGGMRFIVRAALAGLVLFAGCPYGHSIPKNPEAIAPLNTRWDDYNMAPPPGLSHYVWSTNRGSQGQHFDLWTASGHFSSDGFVFRYGSSQEWDGTPKRLDALASPGDEFGPIYADPEERGNTVETWRVEGLVLVFSSDRKGGRGRLDLYRYSDSGIEALPGLNSSSNDSYWTKTDWKWSKHKAALFASDRRGDKGYDIFEVTWKGDIARPFGGPGSSISPVSALNSAADDTAPFAFSNSKREPCVLFVSNRAGGRGGFDLWWSRFRDGAWGEPRNLGSRYNSAHNEFRPCVAGAMLIFSSDRPGGKGGYDLYRARMPDLFD